jgi:hypothetical protein
MKRIPIQHASETIDFRIYGDKYFSFKLPVSLMRLQGPMPAVETISDPILTLSVCHICLISADSSVQLLISLA